MISEAASDPRLALTALRAACASLPALPSVIRYFDDYAEKHRSIKAPERHSIWTLMLDGRTRNLDCGLLGKHYMPLLKHVYSVWLRSVEPATVVTRAESLGAHIERVGTTTIDAMLTMTPDAYRRYWIEKVMPIGSFREAIALRAVLHSLCDLSIGPWSADLHPYVRRLEGARQDRFRTVRTGECFVPLDQQALIVDYLDDLTARLADHAESVGDIELRDACAAIISFQYGFRPGQIARLRISDVRLHVTGAVHLSLPLAKRSSPARHRVTRRIKREWCPLFAAYYHRRIADGGRVLLKGGAPPDSFLGLAPHAMSTMIGELMADIAGEAWTATDLRHTSAQRLVDAGSSHISVSEFMGHASLKTANVYFETSPTQAQRVNAGAGDLADLCVCRRSCAHEDDRHAGTARHAVRPSDRRRAPRHSDCRHWRLLVRAELVFPEPRPLLLYVPPLHAAARCWGSQPRRGKPSSSRGGVRERFARNHDIAGVLPTPQDSRCGQKSGRRYRGRRRAAT